LFIRALVDKKPAKLKGIESYLKSIVSDMKKLHVDGIAFIGMTKKSL